MSNPWHLASSLPFIPYSSVTSMPLVSGILWGWGGGVDIITLFYHFSNLKCATNRTFSKEFGFWRGERVKYPSVWSFCFFFKIQFFILLSFAFWQLRRIKDSKRKILLPLEEGMAPPLSPSNRNPPRLWKTAAVQILFTFLESWITPTGFFSSWYFFPPVFLALFFVAVAATATYAVLRPRWSWKRIGSGTKAAGSRARSTLGRAARRSSREDEEKWFVWRDDSQKTSGDDYRRSYMCVREGVRVCVLVFGSWSWKMVFHGNTVFRKSWDGEVAFLRLHLFDLPFGV